MIALIVLVAALVVPGVAPFLSTRPNRRTSARDRLIRRNPTLADDASLRWSTTARRVRFGWLTTAVVAIAVLMVTTRMTTASNR